MNINEVEWNSLNALITNSKYLFDLPGNLGFRPNNSNNVYQYPWFELTSTDKWSEHSLDPAVIRVNLIGLLSTVLFLQDQTNNSA